MSEQPGQEPKNKSFLYNKKEEQLYQFPDTEEFQYGALTITEAGEWLFPGIVLKNLDGVETEQLVLRKVQIKE